MKKILFTLLASIFCFLGAMEKSDEARPQRSIFNLSTQRDLSGSDYVRVPMQDGGAIITYRGTGYPLQRRTIWEHDLAKDKSGSLTIEYFDDFDKSLFVSKSFLEYRHVDEKPRDWTGVLWRRTQVLERTVDEHRYEGETYTSRAEFAIGNFHTGFDIPLLHKGPTFRIYGNVYRLSVLGLVACPEGKEEIVFSRVERCDFAPTGNETCKKGNGKPWASDPSGQGSGGEQPKTAEAIKQRFKALFPAYVHLLT